MNILLKIIVALLPRILDWIIERNKKEVSDKKPLDLLKAKKRLNLAIESAFNGEAVTKEQKDEIMDAARDLVNGY